MRRRWLGSLLVGMALLATVAPADARVPGGGGDEEQPLRGRSHEHLDPAAARGDARIEHMRNEQRLASGARPPTPKVKNTGDVVVIEDHGEIITPAQPGNPFDLVQGVAFDFRPTGDGFAVDVANAELERVVSEFDAFLPIYDEGSAAVDLPFRFPFFGNSYESVFVNANGNVTFGAPDAGGDFGSEHLLNGPPRIAALMTDLDASWGFIAADTHMDRLVLTWSAAQRGAPDFVQVQATLRADGSVRLLYARNVGWFHRGNVTIGIAPGDGAPTAEVDFSDAPFAASTGAVYETFEEVANLFDLAGSTLRFAPVDGGYSALHEAGGFSAPGAATHSLGPHRTVELGLAFTFPFMGARYGTAYANANGSLTFGAPNTTTSGGTQTLLLGPPAVGAAMAPVPRPLSPTGVAVESAADHLTVTWLDLPSSAGVTRTFQVRIHADGSFAFSYPDHVDIVNLTVGYSGGGGPLTYREVEWVEDLPAVFTGPAVFEVYSDSFISPVDVVGHRVTFTPAATPASQGLRVEESPGGTRLPRDARIARIGAPLSPCGPFACDGFVEVPLGFEFPFLGSSYDTVFVNANGTLTFGAPDLDPFGFSPGQLLEGPPRLAPFGVDVGDVVVEVSFGDGTMLLTHELCDSEFFYCQLFQVELRADGSAAVTYGPTTTPGASPHAVSAVVGVAAGHGAEPITEVDFDAQLPGTFPVGTVFEQFRLPIPFALVDDIQLARRFYERYPDRYDFLVFFTDFPVSLFGGGTIAYAAMWKNETEGIGFPTFDSSSFLGSGGELETTIMMNNVNLYWPDAQRMIDPPVVEDGFRRRLLGLGDGGPIAPVAGEPWSRGLFSPMNVLAHEVLHRWAAYLAPPLGEPFGSAHWSFYQDTEVPAGQFSGGPRSSVLEGNVIHDEGVTADCGGRHHFRTDPAELVDGYSALDQYLMGVRPASAVPPISVVGAPSPLLTDPDAVVFDPSWPAVSGVSFCGDPLQITIADIQGEVGPRVPAFGDEDDDGQGNDVKTIAFVLLTQNSDPKAQAKSAKIVDTFRRTFERYANGPATGWQGRFDTSLTPRIH